MSTEANARIARALEIAACCGDVDSKHHKAWVIDQMVRALTGCPIVTHKELDYDGRPCSFEALGESEEYLDLVAAAKTGEDGPETYEWNTGIAP